VTQALIEDIAFYGVGAATLIAAIRVVRSQNLIHAVLWLAVTLLGTAVLFGMLDAPFLAGIQVLTYIGGVVTLVIFGVMVTRRHEGGQAFAERGDAVRGLLGAGGLTVLLGYSLWRTPLEGQPVPTATAAQIGTTLLTTQVVAFEAASILLLAAIVGAVAIARRKDVDPATGEEPSSLPAFLMRGGTEP
jgi:NADH-quinone oxidoreductase subunit J